MKQIKKWERLTNQMTENWIKTYFQLEFEDWENGLDYYWISDEVGGIFEFSDYFFSFSDVLDCYKHNVNREQLFNWYDYMLSNDSIKLSLAKFILTPEEREKQHQESLETSRQNVIFAENLLRQELEKYDTK